MMLARKFLISLFLLNLFGAMGTAAEMHDEAPCGTDSIGGLSVLADTSRPPSPSNQLSPERSLSLCPAPSQLENSALREMSGEPQSEVELTTQMEEGRSASFTTQGAFCQDQMGHSLAEQTAPGTSQLTAASGSDECCSCDSGCGRLGEFVGGATVVAGAVTLAYGSYIPGGIILGIGSVVLTLSILSNNR